MLPSQGKSGIHTESIENEGWWLGERSILKNWLEQEGRYMVRRMGHGDEADNQWSEG